LSTEVRSKLADKDAIRDLLYLRCRASDRCDVELALSCYHEGAVEIHPGYDTDSAQDFILKYSEMAKGEKSPTYMMWHVLLNMLIDLDGDRAFAETYHLAMHRTRHGDADTHYEIGGRFFDTLEYREGRWGITRREIAMDWSRVAPVGPQFWDLLSTKGGVVRGVRGGADPLYVHAHRGSSHDR
jgi:hypothetical protein